VGGTDGLVAGALAFDPRNAVVASAGRPVAADGVVEAEPRIWVSAGRNGVVDPARRPGSAVADGCAEDAGGAAAAPGAAVVDGACAPLAGVAVCALWRGMNGGGSVCLGVPCAGVRRGEALEATADGASEAPAGCPLEVGAVDATTADDEPDKAGDAGAEGGSDAGVLEAEAGADTVEAGEAASEAGEDGAVDPGALNSGAVEAGDEDAGAVQAGAVEAAVVEPGEEAASEAGGDGAVDAIAGIRAVWLMRGRVPVRTDSAAAGCAAGGCAAGDCAAAGGAGTTGDMTCVSPGPAMVAIGWVIAGTWLRAAV
jgi:hypothetical protein